jgi:RNA polymerase sigma-70 factor (ECF subfamily)
MRPRTESKFQLSSDSTVLPQRPEPSDAQLAERARRGDRLAFAALVERYERVLYNLSLRMLDDPDEARDATQSALVKAFLGISSFDPSRRFYSWIYRIGLNECLNALRRQRVREELDETLPSEGDGPHEQMLRDEQAREIRAALRCLSDGDRAIVLLRHYLDRSYREIGEILDLPEKTVKSRLFSARQRLASLLSTTLGAAR